MASYINIEDRYRCASLRERQMHNVWAATAAAVISVGATATGAAISASAAQKAAKDKSAAAREAQSLDEKALEEFRKGRAKIAKEVGKIKAPKMQIGKDISAAKKITGYNINQAKKITGYNLAQLEKFYPGAKNQRELASMAITDMIQGKLPQATISETMREAAYRGGAGFNLATAGKGAIAQAPQYDYARAIGATSLALTQAGLDQSAKWQNLSSAFIQNVPIQSPTEISGLRYQYGMGKANLGIEKVGIKANLLAAQYGVQTGQAQQGYARQQENIGSSLAARQATAQGISDVGGTIGQAGMAAYGAYNKYATAANAGGGIVTGYGGKQYAPQTSSTGGQYYSAIGGAF